MSDISIKVTDRAGVEHEIQAPTDMNMSLMEAIRAYELADDGTIGVCGGLAMCASCQVYVTAGIEKIAPKDDSEQAMLNDAFNVKENSRLSCQIPLETSLEGLQVVLAPFS